MRDRRSTSFVNKLAYRSQCSVQLDDSGGFDKQPYVLMAGCGKAFPRSWSSAEMRGPRNDSEIIDPVHVSLV
jgi:hypothetical protein